MQIPIFSQINEHLGGKVWGEVSPWINGSFPEVPLFWWCFWKRRNCQASTRCCHAVTTLPWDMVRSARLWKKFSTSWGREGSRYFESLPQETVCCVHKALNGQDWLWKATTHLFRLSGKINQRENWNASPLEFVLQWLVFWFCKWFL